jgi:hypothetical protein
MTMEKHSIYCATGVVLLTLFTLPQTAMAGTDKATDKTTAAENVTAKKELLLQKTAENKTGAAGPAGMQGEAGVAGGSSEVRNWAAIDTNKDYSIQPEEMEKYLTGSWAAQKKSVQKAK